MKSSRPKTAGGEILVPGEPEARMRRQRLAEGVPLPDDTWAAIVETARSVGLDERRIQRATRRRRGKCISRCPKLPAMA